MILEQGEDRGGRISEPAYRDKSGQLDTVPRLFPGIGLAQRFQA